MERDREGMYRMRIDISFWELRLYPVARCVLIITLFWSWRPLVLMQCSWVGSIWCCSQRATSWQIISSLDSGRLNDYHDWLIDSVMRTTYTLLGLNVSLSYNIAQIAMVLLHWIDKKYNNKQRKMYGKNIRISPISLWGIKSVSTTWVWVLCLRLNINQKQQTLLFGIKTYLSHPCTHKLCQLFLCLLPTQSC